MKSVLRGSIARHFYNSEPRFAGWDIVQKFLHEEAKDRPVSRRACEIMLRDSLIGIRETAGDTGYSPYKDRSAHDQTLIVRIVEEAFAPFLIANIPRIAATLSEPWESPRTSVRSIMAEMNLLEAEILRSDWPVYGRITLFNPTKRFRSEEYGIDFGTPDDYFRKILGSRMDSIRELTESFFFDDPHELSNRPHEPIQTTSDHLQSIESVNKPVANIGAERVAVGPPEVTAPLATATFERDLGSSSHVGSTDGNSPMELPASSLVEIFRATDQADLALTRATLNIQHQLVQQTLHTSTLKHMLLSSVEQWVRAVGRITLLRWSDVVLAPEVFDGIIERQNDNFTQKMASRFRLDLELPDSRIAKKCGIAEGEITDVVVRTLGALAKPIAEENRFRFTVGTALNQPSQKANDASSDLESAKHEGQVKSDRPTGNQARSSLRKAIIEPLLKRCRFRPGSWATKAGVPTSVVYDYLNGKTKRLNPDTREYLAQALGIKDEELPE